MQLRKGDLTEAKEAVIIHGCNNRGVMGSGVAKAIRSKWPMAYNVYRMNFESTIPDGLGSFTSYYSTEDEKTIVNLISQDGYGYDGKKYASYTAIMSGLVDIVNWNRYNKITKFAIPKIGCGLGGLKWEIMEIILCDIEELYKVEFVVYEL